MAYQRTEYNREVRHDDDDNNKSGGWRSWFGLDNKDDDRDNRGGYNVSRTTTYRNDDHPSTYRSSNYNTNDRSGSGYSGAVSSGYSGARGGYGYTTSDESRGPSSSWNTDRDYNTRSYGNNTSSYGNNNTSGDRDVYYRQETRTYGGDNNNRSSYTPSRSYGGYSGSDNTSRGYGFSGDRDRDYTTTTSRTTRDYTTSGNTGDRDYGYSTSRSTGPDSRSYGYSTGNDSRGYTTGGYASTGTGGYGNSDSYTSRSGPSYQQTSSYRY